jgi:hypothetical protein
MNVMRPDGPDCQAIPAQRKTFLTRVKLPEPVPVDSFWRNRRHEAVVSELLTHEGRNIFDLRIHEMRQGRLVPTRKGVAIVVARLPQLAKSINKALAKAKDLGLIADDSEGEQ